MSAMKLTKDQQLAFAEVRQAMYNRLKHFSFTEEMLKDKSLFQLVTLTHQLVGHLNYIGTYTALIGVRCGTSKKNSGNWLATKRKTNDQAKGM
jgi:hypothetical protein